MQLQFDPHFVPPPPERQLEAIGFDSERRLNLAAHFGNIASRRDFAETCKCCFDPVGKEWEDIDDPMFGEWLYTMLHKTPDEDFAAYLESSPNRPTASRHTLYLLPLCDPNALEGPAYPVGTWPSWQFLQDVVAAFYSPLRTQLLPAVSIQALRPEVANRECQGWGKQFHAGQILDVINVPEDAYGVMAVTMHDLYPRNDWSFTYGLARQKKRVGVFSFIRHVPDPGDQHYSVPQLAECPLDPAERGALLLHRSAKTLVHELGHMFGLKHCTWYNCLMRGSNGEMVEHQWNPLHLCPVCLRKLHWNIRFDIKDRYAKILVLYEQHEALSPLFAKECKFLRCRLQSLASVAPVVTFCADYLIGSGRELPEIVAGVTVRVVSSFVVDDASRFHAAVGLTGRVLGIEESWAKIDFGRDASNWVSPKKLKKLEVCVQGVQPANATMVAATATCGRERQQRELANLVPDAALERETHGMHHNLVQPKTTDLMSTAKATVVKEKSE